MSVPATGHGEGKHVLDEIRSSLLNYYSVLYSLDGLSLHDRINFLSTHQYPSAYPICNHGGPTHGPPQATTAGGGPAANPNLHPPLPPQFGQYSRAAAAGKGGANITALLDTLAAKFDPRPNNNFIGVVHPVAATSAADSAVTFRDADSTAVPLGSNRPSHTASTDLLTAGHPALDTHAAPIGSGTLIERRLGAYHAAGGGLTRGGGQHLQSRGQHPAAAGYSSDAAAGGAAAGGAAVLSVLGDMCQAVGETNAKLSRLEALSNSVGGNPNLRGFSYRTAASQTRRPSLGGAHNEGLARHLVALYGNLHSQNELNKSRIKIIEANLRATRNDVGVHRNDDQRIGD